MLALNVINQWATQWQTTPQNVLREYLQHFFLSALYQNPEAEHLAFKGGTALRLVFRSPRFSEDLDFTGNLRTYHLEKVLARTLERTAREGIVFQVRESKPTSGGYLALYTCDIHNHTLGLELNVSLRAKAKTEAHLVTSPLLPSYQCLTLPVQDLVREKVEALLFRKKARDFFDLYFLLRERLGLDALIPAKSRLLKEIETLNPKTLQRELKIFLPVSHHKIASRLPQALRAELERL